MSKILFCLSFILILLTSCSSTTIKNSSDDIKWREKVDRLINGTSDAKGHGPDIDSDEWCGVVEFKLFNRTSNLKPCSLEWSQKVDEKLDIK